MQLDPRKIRWGLGAVVALVGAGQVILISSAALPAQEGGRRGSLGGLALILSGVALALAERAVLRKALGLAVLLAGGAALLTRVFSGAELDRFQPAGRAMVEALTESEFILLGAALFWLNWQTARGRAWTQALALTVMFLSFVPLLLYAYGVILPEDTESILNVLANTALFALGIGLLLSGSGRGLVARFRDPGGGGLILRRLLLPAALLPALLVWVRLVGERSGIFSAAVGSSVSVIIVIVALLTVTWWTSSLVHGAERRLATSERRCRRSAEREKRRAQDAETHRVALRTIMDQVPEGILVVDAGGQPEMLNAHGAQMLGVAAQELGAAGTCICRLLQPDGSPPGPEDDPVARVIKGTVITNEEWHLECPDRLIPVLCNASPLHDAEGRITGAVLAWRDITDRKQGEEERVYLLEAERAARAEAERANHAKDQFMAVLSHELRTPLNSILGWTQLLCRGALAPPDAGEALATIEQSARQQKDLIEDLLDIGRITSGTLRLREETVDVVEALDRAIEIVRPAARAKNLHIEKRVLGNCPISGDCARLRQIFWNLLANAIKFTEQGGVTVTVRRGQTALEVEIADTGPGIAPEVLPTIFDVYRQADPRDTADQGGLGLGLAITRQLVELHGGRIRARSAGPGCGSAFVVSLPCEAARARAAAGGEDQLPACRAALRGLRVVVIDDDPATRQVVERVLGQCGAEVLVRGSGRTGFDAVRESRPDVLLSDISMPEEDGYQLIRRIRALPADQGGGVPAVALTALARPEDRERAQQAGYQVHLAKPIETTELIKVVAQLAGRLTPVEQH